jgi:hypothetical protein
MAKKTHSDSDSELARQIRECADECGLTDHVAAGAAGAPVGGLGDGVLFAKLLEFVKLILPILLPLITNEKPKA